MDAPDDGFTTTEIAISLSISTYMAKQRLDALVALKMIIRESQGGNQGDTWCIRYEHIPVLENFFAHNSEFVLGVKPPKGIY